MGPRIEAVYSSITTLVDGCLELPFEPKRPRTHRDERRWHAIKYVPATERTLDAGATLHSEHTIVWSGNRCVERRAQRDADGIARVDRVKDAVVPDFRRGIIGAGLTLITF
jgi:hypothetical protein